MTKKDLRKQLEVALLLQEEMTANGFPAVRTGCLFSPGTSDATFTAGGPNDQFGAAGVPYPALAVGTNPDGSVTALTVDQVQESFEAGGMPAVFARYKQEVDPPALRGFPTFERMRATIVDGDRSDTGEVPAPAPKRHPDYL